jgi:hypothetical protein
MIGFNKEQFLQVIRLHADRYPLMEPADAVKLAYQSTFGGGHLIRDAQASLLRLCAERAAAESLPDAPFIEIGNERARMNLASPALSTFPDALLNRMFVLSAQTQAGTMALFHELLELLSSLAVDGVFRFDSVVFSEYLRTYTDAGCPMVSHSEAYRRAYHPSYRVVDMIYAQLLPVVADVQQAVASGNPETRVPLDGLYGLSPERIRTAVQALFDETDVACRAASGAPFLLVCK